MNVKKYYQCCAVPCCRNTTIKTPTKLFIHVPAKTDIRIKWLKLARVKNASAKSNLFYCEDHFDLPNDMENYMEYHLLGSVKRILMKRTCLPSKFAFPPDRKKQTTTTLRDDYLKRQTKELVEALLRDLKVNETEEVCIDSPHLSEPSSTGTGICNEIKNFEVCIENSGETGNAIPQRQRNSTMAQDSGPNNRCRLLSKLVSMKLDQFPTVREYVRSMMMISRELQDLGKEVDDEVLAALLLQGLTPEFQPMKLAIENSNIILTTGYVKTVLFQMENIYSACSSASQSKSASLSNKHKSKSIPKIKQNKR